MSAAATEAVHDNRHAALRDQRTIGFTVNLPASERERFLAFWSDYCNGGKFEARQALRAADRRQGIESLQHLMNQVLRVAMTCGQSYVIAGLLASMYNGQRVKVNLSDLGRLDAELLEHVIHVMRLHHEGFHEIHRYLVNGGDLFEKMIADYRLERRRRGTR